MLALTVLIGFRANAQTDGSFPPCGSVLVANLQTLPDDPLNSPSGAVSFSLTGSNGNTIVLLADEFLAVIDNIFDDGNGNFTYFPLAAGNYNISYFDFDENCSSNVPFTISAGSCSVPVPTISLSGSPFVCDGNTVTLTSSAATGNIWSTGETTQSIDVSTSGNYTVSVSDGICTVSSSQQNIQIVPAPDAPTFTANGPTTFCDGGSVMFTVDPLSSPPPGGAPAYTWNTGGLGESITVTNSGFYFVTIQDGNGCFSTSFATEVIVNPNPTPVVNASGSTTFCDGNDVTLDAGAGYVSYSWSNGDITQSISVSSSNTLFVVVTDNNNCSGSSAPVSVTVNNNPAPNISTSTGGTVLCTGSTMNLLSSEPTGNSWSNGGNLPATTIQTGGDYFLTVVDANNCSGSAQITITETNCTPTTQLRSVDCSRQNFALTGIMLANPVSGANRYEFEFSTNGNVYAIKQQNSNQLSIASVSPAFQWGTEYAVRVRVRIGTTFGDFGPVCNIRFLDDPNIAGVPTTQLVNANCGRLNFNPVTGIIGANNVPVATKYEFEFSQGGVVYATRISTNRFCGFNVISPALQAGQQYNVRVRVHIANVIGNFSNSCVIGLTGGGARFGLPYEPTASDYELQAGEELPIELNGNAISAPEVLAMPNPFTGNATLVLSNFDGYFNVNIYNVEGKLVESLNNQNQNYINIGSNLIKGIYFVEVLTENGFIQRTKIVKAD